jgi:hypothetical protein
MAEFRPVYPRYLPVGPPWLDELSTALFHRQLYVILCKRRNGLGGLSQRVGGRDGGGGRVEQVGWGVGEYVLGNTVLAGKYVLY